MRRESAKFLRDILEAGDRIGHYTSGKTRDAFLAESLVREAVNWNFSVIGEALSQLHKLDASTAEKINEWRRIIAFRNQLSDRGNVEPSVGYFSRANCGRRCWSSCRKRKYILRSRS